MNHLSLPRQFRQKPLRVALLTGVVTLSPAVGLAGCATGNPCAGKNPCKVARACNPCAGKNPCGARKACNPCAAKKMMAKGCNPCAAKKACNPCNPCGGAAVKASMFKRPPGVSVPVDPSLIAEGKRLWNDPGLSTNGLSCNTCHQNYASLNKTFAQPYPHWIAMPDQMAGAKTMYADEMVQFCMIVPMKSKPLPWNSRELAALTAYTVALQQGFNPCMAGKAGCNPCNPCAAKKACNPCNPCAAKKACNPCAARKGCNPCNPCAAKKKW